MPRGVAIRARPPGVGVIERPEGNAPSLPEWHSGLVTIRLAAWSGRGESNTHHCVGSAGSDHQTAPAIATELPVGIAPTWAGYRPALVLDQRSSRRAVPEALVRAWQVPLYVEPPRGIGPQPSPIPTGCTALVLQRHGGDRGNRTLIFWLQARSPPVERGPRSGMPANRTLSCGVGIRLVTMTHASQVGGGCPPTRRQGPKTPAGFEPASSTSRPVRESNSFRSIDSGVAMPIASRGKPSRPLEREEGAQRPSTTLPKQGWRCRESNPSPKEPHERLRSRA